MMERIQKAVDNKKERFRLWRERHETVWQLIMFLLIGCITMGIDLASFALFNFWVFAPYRDQPFSWWLVDYSVKNGGLTAFLAYASSYAVAQTFNFFLQRKTTFKANNNVAKSAVMYATMVILIYFMQIYLPTLLRVHVVAVFGAALGDMIVKLINMLGSTLIQFPTSKWLIMRKS